MSKSSRGSACRGLAGAGFVMWAAALCGGCTGHFSTQTEYIAPGFTRDSLRGRTVAVVPPPGGVGVYEDELVGIALGLNEAGARVAFSPPVEDPGAGTGQVNPGPTAAVTTTDAAPPAAPSVAGPRHLPTGGRRTASPRNPAYVLRVEFTDAAVYRSYAVPRDRGGAGRAAAASRTSGRRVGLRLALLRNADGVAAWLAGGEGEMWRSRTAAAPGAAPAAANVDEDLGGGNLPLYPAPPRADTVTRRLVRRLLAHVPSPPALQPN